jgi:hypothetical protein
MRPHHPALRFSGRRLPASRRKELRRSSRLLGAGFLALALAAAFAPGSAAAAETRSSESGSAGGEASDPLVEKWGIQVSSVFLSAGGNMVDFRYRIIDPVKATSLTKPEIKPTLLDESSGARLHVPSSPKVGPMRQTTRQPVAGKLYFMLFANTQHHVKRGDKVTVVAGDFRAENLTVE